MNAVRVPFIGSAIGMIPELVLDVGEFAYDCEVEGIAARPDVRMRSNIAKERIKLASRGVICRLVLRDSN